MTIHGRFRILVIIVSGIVVCSTIASLALFQYKAVRTKKITSGIITRIIETTIGERMFTEVNNLAEALRASPESEHLKVLAAHFPQRQTDVIVGVRHVFYSLKLERMIYSDVPTNEKVFASDLARVKAHGGSFIEEANGKTWYVRMNYVPGSDYVCMLKLDIEPINRDLMEIFEPMVAFFRFIMIGTIVMSVLVLSAIQISSFPIFKRVAYLEERLNEKNSELQQINLLLNVEVDIRKTIESELKKANGELHRISRTDPLTKIPNRRYFDEVMKKEWKAHLREQRSLSVILCDVDMFKRYNDEYGHQKGDGCLTAVASVIKKVCRRPFDFVARYGGEEFVAVLPETDASGAAIIANSLVENMRARNIPHKGSSVDSRVTLSVGVATMIPENGKSPETLLKKADKALYRAKEEGRNRWVNGE